MPRVLLSTSIGALPSGAGALIERLQGLGAADGIALDPRLAPELRRAVLAAALRARVPCPELSHPGAGLPSPVSQDRGERRAARAALELTLDLAARGACARVLLPPALLPLRPERAELARCFARGEPLDLEGIDELRRELSAPARSALASVLEPCLRRAQDLGLWLVLPLPAPWPHAFPDGDELAQLAASFAGAPLAGCLCLDWIEVLRALRPEQEPPAPTLPIASLRVADACGLSQRLPLGAGEGRWRAQLDALGAEARAADRVLTLRPDVTAGEVASSLAALAVAG